MRSSDGIIGLTLTELAFLMVLSVILFLVIGAGDRQRLQAALAASQRKVKEVTAVYHELQTAKDELEKELARRPAPGPLRSIQRPSCIEKGMAAGFLLTVTIVGADAYLLRGSDQSVTLIELRDRYRSDLASAEASGCVHSANVYYNPTVRTGAYDIALRRLQQLLYTRLSGAS